MRVLEGIRVLDLADEKGEFCGRLLADLGAEVLRGEPPGGARSRRLPPFAPDGETSLYFALRNAGKRGVVVDPSSAEGWERLDALLAESDFLIESFPPGEFVLSPDRHPALIHVSITDFGHTGPYRGYQGTDLVGFAMGGMMHRAGAIEKPPVTAPGALAYDATGITAAYAALLAYWKRLQTGRGQHLDVSVMESVANLSDWSIATYSASPRIVHRAGAGMYTLYRCQDGYIRMIILVKHHWRALLDWMGNPEELMRPEFDELLGRLVAMDEIVAVTERFFIDKKKIEVAREAQARGIPATPLLTPAEVLANEHTEARGTFRSLEVAEGLRAQVPSGFLTVDGERVGPRSRPARFAEDDRFVSRDGSAPPVEASPDGYPLRGVRVLDFGVGAVGVEVGRLLAEYGADVIKIETRHAPDFIRVVLGGYMNPCFASSNRSKRGFGVNLKTERGLELVRELVRIADVLIENNGSGVMQRFGLGAADLRRLNPQLVAFSSQMVGSSGPWKDWIGYGPNTHPVSGLQHLWNYAEDEARPAGSTNVYPDHFCGRLGAAAVLAGLVRRARIHEGLHADAAQFESAIGLLGDLLAQESLSPGSVRPLGNTSIRGVPWGCYPCAGNDEWCVICVRSDDEWEELCAELGNPPWSRSLEFETAPGRMDARAEIDRRLAEWTLRISPREVMERLQARGIPAGIVAHPGHHVEDPQLAARGYPLRIEQPGLGPLLLEGSAFRGSDLPPPITRPAPRLGEHTREIASELLGLSDGEIDALIREGVLEDPPDG